MKSRQTSELVSNLCTGTGYRRVITTDFEMLHFFVQECFPHHVHIAFIIKPEKFWEKQKTSLGSAKYKFEVRDLSQHVRSAGFPASCAFGDYHTGCVIQSSAAVSFK